MTIIPDQALLVVQDTAGIIVGERVWGHIYNDGIKGGSHPFPDGHFVSINKIRSIVQEGDEYEVETESGSHYRIITKERHNVQTEEA